MKVSIVLPNLNGRRFLDERVETICAQTLTDFEVVVVDGFSEDGSFEILQKWAAWDSRVRLHQVPRGLYASWNKAISLTRGDYVYIAPVDDGMSPTLLETMSTALDTQGGCDIAHCKLILVDDQGHEHPTATPWNNFYGTLYFSELINKPHVRKAPHDGLLHCAVRTVYTSLTQLLVRRSLFEGVGFFRTDLGSHADFEWGMRVALVANTVHVPQYLASWRLHQDQGTNIDFLQTAAFERKLLKMVKLALGAATKIKPELKNLDLEFLRSYYTKRLLQLEMNQTAGHSDRVFTAARWLLSHPRLFFRYWQSRREPHKPFIVSMEPLSFARELITHYGLERNLIDLSES